MTVTTWDIARSVVDVIQPVKMLEGGGFEVQRVLPTPQLAALDPFLLFDHLPLKDNGPGEAIGAPEHPHAGFQTIGAVLVGSNEHRDSRGNRAVVHAGGVQWMVAGSGVMHSELPGEGLVRDGGPTSLLQIWVDLPAEQKNAEPAHAALEAADIPTVVLPEGARVRVVAGDFHGQHGPIEPLTAIHFLHGFLEADGRIHHTIPGGWNALVHVIDGSVTIDGRAIDKFETARLSGAGDLHLYAEDGAEVIILAGQPTGNKVVRYGPFVSDSKTGLIDQVTRFEAGEFGTIEDPVS